MAVSVVGSPIGPSGVDPDEIRAMYIPAWVTKRLPFEGWVREVETRVYDLCREKELAPRRHEFREPTPVWVQFVTYVILVDSGAHSMRERYADVDRALDALRDDAGLRDAVRSACMLGGFSAVRQFVASMREAQGDGHV